MTEKLRERLTVIQNIALACAEGDLHRKVEPNDPEPSAQEIRHALYRFDLLRRHPIEKIKTHIGCRIADRMTKAFNTDTAICGMEHAQGIRGGAILTSNHFAVTDTTLPRMVARAVGRRDRFDIMIQEKNLFMPGFFGFLMNHCRTLPVSQDAKYLSAHLKPAIRTLLQKGHFILIYPEQEMWFRYKKPRTLRDGAYHYAAENGVPILPCFTEMQATEAVDEDGFFRIRHVFHIGAPIYPDPALTVRENRAKMKAADAAIKRGFYEQAYGKPPSDAFDPAEDIAGFPLDGKQLMQSLLT